MITWPPQHPILQQIRCSTFLLRQPHTFLIGHNLDAPYPVPGVIACNPRNTPKRSISFFELVSGRKPPAPELLWTSRYGSITFNPMGCEFPDGGINEVGLYVQEMTLPGTRFPDNPHLPRMFMAQWIQYLLDTCQSVADVLASIDRVALDGWEWHFFVADQSGRYAAIDFFDGQPHSYTDAAMPIPVLCNACYAEELAKLAAYEGFGGQQSIQLNDIRFGRGRFVQAADLLRLAPRPASVADTICILEQLERGSTQWSHLIDMSIARVYFRSAQARQLKYLDIPQLDFSAATPLHVLDFNREQAGDVTTVFSAYSAESNQQLVQEVIETADGDGGFTYLVEQHDETLPGLIQRIADYLRTIGVL
jgi:penicillin V acylase-like amidase (Ntn superfamily)